MYISLPLFEDILCDRVTSGRPQLEMVINARGL